MVLDFQFVCCKALLLIQRMILDWDKLPPSLRKPWNVKDTTTLHSACAGYLHFMSVLQRKIPKADYDSSAAGLREQFLSGFLDVEILQTLESSAPPLNLEDVGFLRLGAQNWYCLGLE